jgi:hypothetical protein
MENPLPDARDTSQAQALSRQLSGRLREVYGRVARGLGITAIGVFLGVLVSFSALAVFG